VVDRIQLCRRSGWRGHRDSLCEHIPAFREGQGRGRRRRSRHLGLKVGEKITVEWRGKPVWILKRSPEQLAELPKLDGQLADPLSKRHPDEFTPKYAQNEHRSIKPDVLVVVGICTHLGCSPVDRLQAGPQPSLPPTGKAASSALATVPRSIWPAASSRTSPRPTTCLCPRTCTCRTPSS
jgi:hypothetical protein